MQGFFLYMKMKNRAGGKAGAAREIPLFLLKRFLLLLFDEP